MPYRELLHKKLGVVVDTLNQPLSQSDALILTENHRHFKKLSGDGGYE